MKRILIGGGLAAFTALSIVWFGLDTPDSEQQSTLRIPSATRASAPTPDPQTHPLPNTPKNSPTTRPDLLAYEEYQRLFQLSDAIREYLDSRDSLTDTEQAYREVELERQLNRLEADKKVTASEALALRLALIEPDDEQAKAKGLALIEQYDRERQERLAAIRANPDPEFRSYKAREAEIVKEVLAMDHYPDGLSREEYLARRLAEARQDAYQ